MLVQKTLFFFLLKKIHLKPDGSDCYLDELTNVNHNPGV